ncbi:transposase [Saccharibacillus sacchari]|uniref:transposase n=1 Tax=Saccharibacillus sacchari TaxID=456493 RepID=UPI0004B6174B|nr:transposase [Saccharibacillus sacchari]
MDIRELLQSTAKQAQIVVSDVAPAMSKAIRNACPQAVHVLDRFRLIQFFTDSMKQRRKMPALGRNPRREIPHTLRLLTVKPERLTDEERREVREHCR